MLSAVGFGVRCSVFGVFGPGAGVEWRGMLSNEVMQILEGQPDGVADLVLAARKLILSIAPGLTESVVWGELSYHDAGVGGRVKGAVCQIRVRDGMVLLGFVHGAGLHDPKGLLRGSGVAKRFLPVRSARDLAGPAVRALIRSAAELPKTLFGRTRP